MGDIPKTFQNLIAERDATILRLMEQANTLTTEKHADAEAIGTLEAKLAEVMASVDRLNANCAALAEDAAKAHDEGFAHGVEAVVAAYCENDDEFLTSIGITKAIRALSPTPQADPVREAARVLLDADEYMPDAAKMAAIKATTLREGKARPVAIADAWRAALRALAQKGE